MIQLVYYVPLIPEVWSTDRYQHALAITEVADSCLLLTKQEPPDLFYKKASSIHVLESKSIINRGKEAAEYTLQFLDDGYLVTAGHEYECTIAGALVSQQGGNWVPDIFEVPAMARVNKPWSIHQLTTRVNEILLNSVDLGIHSFHPATPYQYGKERVFLSNGSPVSQLEADITFKGPLRVGLVSTYPSFLRGGEYLLRAASRVESKIEVHICGEATTEMKELASKLSLEEVVTFHGWVDHSEALNQVSVADVGYCVLPSRSDYKYSPPIKVGEYLAGGTIPLVSDLPGSRLMAKEAGYYVTPSVEDVTTALTELATMSSNKLEQRQQKARKRGEEIAWEIIRERFTNLLLEKHDV